jgi:hypothetical protein
MGGRGVEVRVVVRSKGHGGCGHVIVGAEVFVVIVVVADDVVVVVIVGEEVDLVFVGIGWRRGLWWW